MGTTGMAGFDPIALIMHFLFALEPPKLIYLIYIQKGRGSLDRGYNIIRYRSMPTFVEHTINNIP